MSAARENLVIFVRSRRTLCIVLADIAKRRAVVVAKPLISMYTVQYSIKALLMCEQCGNIQQLCGSFVRWKHRVRLRVWKGYRSWSMYMERGINWLITREGLPMLAPSVMPLAVG